MRFAASLVNFGILPVSRLVHLVLKEFDLVGQRVPTVGRWGAPVGATGFVFLKRKEYRGRFKGKQQQ